MPSLKDVQQHAVLSGRLRIAKLISLRTMPNFPARPVGYQPTHHVLVVKTDFVEVIFINVANVKAHFVAVVLISTILKATGLTLIRPARWLVLCIASQRTASQHMSDVPLTAPTWISSRKLPDLCSAQFTSLALALNDTGTSAPHAYSQLFGSLSMPPAFDIYTIFPGGCPVSTQRNPHLLMTVKCAGPGCANIRRESNHWFLITIEPATFICRPLSSAIDLQEADKPVCGQACAQKLLECFLAKTVSHSPHHQPSHPDQSASRHHGHPISEHNMQTPAPNHSQPTPPINEQSAAPISNQYAPTARLTQPALASCVYIGLQCSQCGDVRQALNDLPAGETTLCPQCGATCCFSRLGTGLTSRELPFHEITSPAKQNVTPFHQTPETALHPHPWQEA